jgi:4a-hydroxytetrahydrobiopterin dehydratase
MTALSDDEISEALRSGLPDWSYENGAIRKEYVFKGFRSAIAFVNRLAEKAEEAKHHPDLENHYNRVIVALHTWDEDGVTDKDVALARAIESVSAPPEA